MRPEEEALCIGEVSSAYTGDQGPEVVPGPWDMLTESRGPARKTQMAVMLFVKTIINIFGVDKIQ